MTVKTRKIIRHMLCIGLAGWTSLYAIDNQTDTLSPIIPETTLPFTIQIEQADFSLPNGLHSGAFAVYKGKWLFITGRTNGMHTFDNNNNNFPPSEQNRMVYVIDPVKKTARSRSLNDPESGLTQHQVDLLSVTSPQFYQSEKKLYITGGYGVDSSNGTFTTKDALTAINIPGLIHWVTRPSEGETAVQHIKQIFNPIFQVTGGFMSQFGHGPTLLIFGQDFEGAYIPSSNGIYTEQVRRFYIHDHDDRLSVKIKSSSPRQRDPNFRRRDLNVVPIVKKSHGDLLAGYIAFAGVFTPSENHPGVWTVPVNISTHGKTFMADPSLASTFKQGMNQYICATLGLFSKKTGSMYTVLLGGISYGFFVNGVFHTSDDLPFINQVTTIGIDKRGNYQQYIMNGQYPVILSTQSNPGNQLLFGASAFFIPAEETPQYSNGVFKLDSLEHPKVLGYVVGGIQSSVINTETSSDSAASPYIFTVKVVPKHHNKD